MMQCYVYKSLAKQDHFIYLPEEYYGNDKDSDLPEGLITMLGELEFVVDFQLSEQRSLPNADSKQVIDSIQQQGFYLQMPKKDMYLKEDDYFN